MCTDNHALDDPRPPFYLQVSFTRFVGYFLRLGTIGFGGPIALAGHMQQDLVDERRWVSKEDYLEGLALAQLAPGPLAAQLAIYLGYVRAGVLGATAVGVAFVLPSFLVVLALSAAYVRFGGLAWMQGMFYGIGAAVIGIIARSAFKLTKLTLGKDKLLWGIFAVLAIATAWTSQEIIWLFLLAGIISLLVKSFPIRVQTRSAVPLLFTVGAAGAGGSLWGIFFYFAKAGMFVFGSGLAVVPFLYGGVVQGHHWLTDRQFVDAVAVAMITPGPVVITSGFIGFLVAGFAGAFLAALGAFLPCYAFVVIAAPAFRKYGKRPAIAAFVKGVTAAATGAITGAGVILGRRTITDIPTVLLALVHLLLLWRWKKIPEPFIVLGAAIIGLVVYSALHH